MNKLTLIFVFLTSISSWLHAQTTPSSDDLFKNARDAAFEEKNYDKARLLAYEALEKSPAYGDIDVFIGRLFTWEKNFDSAQYHFTKVLNVNPANEDASIAYADLEYWNDYYEKSLQICDSALAIYPTSEDLLIRKAKNLNALKKYKEASQVTSALLQSNKNNTAALSLAVRIKDAVAINKITVGYENSTFDKQFDKPWYLGSIYYGRQTKLGSVIARINYANRFSSNGIQGEVDVYPHISKTFYSYINFGYSGNVGVFPNYRAGFSLYANLPKSFEAEVGTRYLYFTSATHIFTASVGKYYKNYLFTARTYLTPSPGTLSQSYSLAARYYLAGADDYIGLTMGTGISPDDNLQIIQFSNKLERLSSKKISASFDHTFLKWNVISISAGLINQEYAPSVRGNQFNVSVSISHRF
ncbi:MAG: YaiO family outer membrane beta-barrel protein [Ginsengibacter sp.]